ncbi:hypothetical protein [Sporolactobacillus pectinivorans]|uniref:hypothetical protein n=1 Tax=Sporolactobacillus pectinivorans TaxID=1591408 RepID=UPI000C258C81|nr:hypothetical protein [Sporolactobacillus pectinivorans]
MNEKFVKIKNYISNSIKNINYVGLGIGVFSGLLVMIICFKFFDWSIKRWNILPSTWIQTLSTLIGAFLGAKIAGNNAIKTVQYQLNKLDERDNDRKNKELLKILIFYKGHAITIMGNLESVDPILKMGLSTGLDANNKKGIADSLNNMLEYFTNEENELGKIDISTLEREDFFLMQPFYEGVKDAKTSFLHMIKLWKEENIGVYKIYLKKVESIHGRMKTDYKKMIEKIEKTIN